MLPAHTVYLLIGSNLGEPAQNLQDCANRIASEAGQIVKLSSFYRTEPWGNKDQLAFLNQVLCIRTELEAERLLDCLLGIERAMGRTRSQRWEPRIIDADILLYDDAVIDRPGLQVPHPLMGERRFTLVPLSEIAPGIVHPVNGKTIERMLAECPDNGLVEKL